METEEFDLRSLIAPNHELTYGLGESTFKLKNGKTVTGIEFTPPNANTHHVFNEEAQNVFINKKTVASITRVSPMPNALTYLTHREIRDIVAYLSQN